MSALYLGTGKLETFLLKKIKQKIEKQENMRTSIIFDYMGGLRFNRDGESTFTMIRNIKAENEKKKIRMGFYHNPDTNFFKGKTLNGTLREIFGVHHIKAHVFDDTVLLTGANLSEDYFTDR